MLTNFQEILKTDNVTLDLKDDLSITFEKCKAALRDNHLGCATTIAALNQMDIKFEETNYNLLTIKAHSLANCENFDEEFQNAYQQQRVISQRLTRAKETIMDAFKTVDIKAINSFHVTMQAASAHTSGTQIKIEFTDYHKNPSSMLSYRSMRAALNQTGVEFDEQTQGNFPFILIPNQDIIDDSNFSTMLAPLYQEQRSLQIGQLIAEGVNIDPLHDIKLKEKNEQLKQKEASLKTNLEMIPQAILTALEASKIPVECNPCTGNKIAVKVIREKDETTNNCMEILSSLLKKYGLTLSISPNVIVPIIVDPANVDLPADFVETFKNEFTHEYELLVSNQRMNLMQLEKAINLLMHDNKLNVAFVDSATPKVVLSYVCRDQYSEMKFEAIHLALQKLDICGGKGKDRIVYSAEVKLAYPDFEEKLKQEYAQQFQRVFKYSKMKKIIESVLATTQGSKKDTVNVILRATSGEIQLSFPSYHPPFTETTINYRAMENALLALGLIDENDSHPNSKLRINPATIEIPEDFENRLRKLYLENVEMIKREIEQPAQEKPSTLCISM